MLAFGAGVALGYLLQPTPSEPARIGSPRSSGEGARASADAGAGRPFVTLRRAIEELPAPERLPAGTGTIQGRVFDDIGDPIPEAVVVAQPVWNDSPRKSRHMKRQPPEGRDHAEWVADAIRGWRRDLLNRIEARVDAEGRYLLEGLSDRKYTLSAIAPGFVLVPKPPRSMRAVAVGSRVDFEGVAHVEVPVEVRLPDGRLADHARLRYQHGFFGDTDDWYSETPWAELPCGSYKIWAESPGDTALKSEPQQVSPKRGQPHPPLVFDLRGRAGLLAYVAFPEGFAPRDIWVVITRIEGDEIPDPHELSEVALLGSQFSEDGRGRVWNDLAVGRYLVGAGWFRDQVDVTQVVEVPHELVRCELELPVPKPRDYLVTRIVGPQGELLPDTRLGLAIRGGGRSATLSAEVIRRADGVWFADDGVPQGESSREDTRFTVRASHRKYGWIQRDFRPGTGSVMELRFDEPAHATIRVEDLVGSGLEDRLELQLRLPVPKPPVLAKPMDGSKVGEGGTLRLGPYQPGRYELQVTHLQSWQESWVLATHPVDLRVGEQQVTIPLPDIHSITVHCPGASSDAVIELRNLVKDRGRWTFVKECLGKDRKVTFAGFPAGRYRISCPSEKGKVLSTELDLPGPETITLE